MQNYTLTATAGDLLECYFICNSVDESAVEELCFSCKGQGICVHLPYSKLQGGYCLRLGSEITSKFRPKTCYYDLTAKLIDGNTVTLIYQGTLIVRGNGNKACEE